MFFYFAIIYFVGALCSLLLLTEDRPVKGEPFIIKTNWAIWGSLLWPFFWGYLVIGGLVQFLKQRK